MGISGLLHHRHPIAGPRAFPSIFVRVSKCNIKKVFSFSHHRWDPFFTIFAFLGIILGRLINIYPISELVNFSRPAEAKIPERFLFLVNQAVGTIFKDPGPGVPECSFKIVQTWSVMDHKL